MKIFNQFSQADSSTTRKFGGTGLGLSISRSLLELMASELKLESKEGKGSSFYFVLDLSSDEVPRESSSNDGVTIVRSRGSLERILVVEDNPDNQKLAKKILEKAGYLVDLAKDGQKAVQAAENYPYKLILMDIEMPLMDGFEATKQIRAFEIKSSRKRVPIIALTAHALQEYKERCLKDGMDDYTSKPLRKNILLDKIEKWINGFDNVVVVDELQESSKV